MGLGKYLIGLIMLGIVFTGITVFLGGVQTEYEFEVDDYYSDVYDDLNSNIYANGSSLRQIQEGFADTVSGADQTGIPFLGYVDSIFKIIVGSVKGSLESVNVFTGMGNAVFSFVPGLRENPWILDGILLIATISVLIILLGIIARRNMR
jgi:hypothetical protein